MHLTTIDLLKAQIMVAPYTEEQIKEEITSRGLEILKFERATGYCEYRSKKEVPYFYIIATKPSSADG